MLWYADPPKVVKSPSVYGTEADQRGYVKVNVMLPESALGVITVFDGISRYGPSAKSCGVNVKTAVSGLAAFGTPSSACGRLAADSRRAILRLVGPTPAAWTRRTALQVPLVKGVVSCSTRAACSDNWVGSKLIVEPSIPAPVIGSAILKLKSSMTVITNWRLRRIAASTVVTALWKRNCT